jgi:hypothetical protein
MAVLGKACQLVADMNCFLKLAEEEPVLGKSVHYFTAYCVHTGSPAVPEGFKGDQDCNTNGTSSLDLPGGQQTTGSMGTQQPQQPPVAYSL